MSDATLRKIIVTTVALLSLLVWGLHEKSDQSAQCAPNCVTDISARRR
jgi:hypothetical protein